MVGVEILADLREPFARQICGEHSANHGAAGVPNRLTDWLRDSVVADVAVIELRHHGAACGDVAADDVDGLADVVLHVREGALQGLATRRELALEGDDLVTYVEFCGRSRCASANSHDLSLLRRKSAKTRFSAGSGTIINLI